jgi:hypothetical protein
MEPKAFVGDRNTFIELDGAFYQTTLEQLHSILRPQTYLEIGTPNGDTFSSKPFRTRILDWHQQANQASSP